jgi:hypothetical protein
MAGVGSEGARVAIAAAMSTAAFAAALTARAPTAGRGRLRPDSIR